MFSSCAAPGRGGDGCVPRTLPALAREGSIPRTLPRPGQCGWTWRWPRLCPLHHASLLPETASPKEVAGPECLVQDLPFLPTPGPGSQ